MTDSLSLASQELLQTLRKELEEISNDGSARSLDSRRWFHGRGHCVPELSFLCIDFFDPILHLTLFKAPESDVWLGQFVADLVALLDEFPQYAGIEGVNVQERFLEGAPSEVVWGSIPEPLYAQRGEQKFIIKLGQRQNTGFFLDMEPGRRWIETQAPGKRVLNLFSYTCAFSVVALQAGAECVVNVDMASGALNQGRDNHRLNGLPKQASQFMCENILKSWSRIRKRGPYDIVVLDPPSFQRGSFVASKDYARLVRRLPEMMPQGGQVLACLNAPELGEDFVRSLFAELLPGSQFLERLAAHEDFPDVDPSRQLKLMVFKVPAQPLD